MERLKLEPTSWCGDEVLLALQNERLFCDARLICSEGYLLIHKVLVPRFNANLSDVTAQYSIHFDMPSPSEILLPSLSLSEASKLVLLIYSGEALLSKQDHRQLKTLLHAFQISHLKRVPFPPASVPNTRGRRSSTSPSITPSTFKYSSKEALTQRKVLAVKVTGGGGGEPEDVYIFGDGSIMGAPMSPGEQEVTTGSSICFDEGGVLLTDALDKAEDKGFFCAECDLIFCDMSDFIRHSMECQKRRVVPSTSLTVIAMEETCVKVEEGVTVIKAEKLEEEMEVQQEVPRMDKGGGTGGSGGVLGGQGSLNLRLCLICVSCCKDASELIIHCNDKHNLSPNSDYDIGSWKCGRCDAPCASPELSVFLQHVFHCKTGKRKRLDKECSFTDNPDDVTPSKRLKAVLDDDKQPAACSTSAPPSCATQPIPTPTPPHSPLNSESFGIPKISQILSLNATTSPQDDKNPTATSSSTIASPPPPPPERVGAVFPAVFSFPSNPAVTYKGITLNQGSRSGFRRALGYVNREESGSFSSRQGPPPHRQYHSTSHWIRKKRRHQSWRPVPSAPAPVVAAGGTASSSLPWKCYRCWSEFPTQQKYMRHDCRTLRPPPPILPRNHPQNT